MRVTITDLDHESHDIERRVAEAEGVEFVFLDGGVDAGLDPRVKGSEGLVVQYARVDAEVMDFLLPELKVIGRYGVGVDTIDLDAAEQRGIVVVNVPDYGTQAVADHAIMLALAVARNLPGLQRVSREGSLDVSPAAPIHQFDHQVFGVLGFGRIGRATAIKARGLGFDVQVCDIKFGEGTTEVEGFRVVDHAELYGSSDILSLHIPMSDDNRNLINEQTLAQIKDGTILINTARGGIADTDALVGALASGKLRGAGLDVLGTEPCPPEHPLRDFERVILTPHSAFYSEESYSELKRRTMQNTIDVMKGRDCANIVVPRPS